jgi:hypothetical protein
MASCGEQPADEANDSAESVAPSATEMASSATPESAALPRSASADGASVFLITPIDGATVKNPIRIEFGIDGMDVVRAGDMQPNSGHHHLLIDTEVPDLGLPIPADEHHIHFGDGSTSAEIELAPGQHSLQMLLGDYLHIPHIPPLVSVPVKITVE